MLGLELNLLDVGSMYDGKGQGDTYESSVEFKKCLKRFSFQVKAFASPTDLSSRSISIIKLSSERKTIGPPGGRIGCSELQ